MIGGDQHQGLAGEAGERGAEEGLEEPGDADDLGLEVRRAGAVAVGDVIDRVDVEAEVRGPDGRARGLGEVGEGLGQGRVGRHRRPAAGRPREGGAGVAAILKAGRGDADAGERLVEGPRRQRGRPLRVDADEPLGLDRRVEERGVDPVEGRLVVEPLEDPALADRRPGVEGGHVGGGGRRELGRQLRGHPLVDGAAEEGQALVEAVEGAPPEAVEEDRDHPVIAPRQPAEHVVGQPRGPGRVVAEAGAHQPGEPGEAVRAVERAAAIVVDPGGGDGLEGAVVEHRRSSEAMGS
ncbi:MAG: hypothetical protein R3B09_05955 [Nannocystaceae bacterium]